MGEPMTMNRVIHAAVRRDGWLEGALDRAEDGDSARASQLDRAYANLHRELQHHHESEDRIIYPYVATIAPAEELLKVMDEEHRVMAEALAERGRPWRRTCRALLRLTRGALAEQRRAHD